MNSITEYCDSEDLQRTEFVRSVGAIRVFYWNVTLQSRDNYHSIQEAAQLAGARGTTVDWFSHNDPRDLERRLELHRERPRKIMAVTYLTHQNVL